MLEIVAALSLGLGIPAQMNLLPFTPGDPQPSIDLSATEEVGQRRPVDPLSVEEAEYQTYAQVIQQVQTMTGDPQARSLAQRYGLDIMNVTWEDTGRSKGSVYGPNISDMTIQVQHRHPSTDGLDFHLMPVIRQPNFEDITSDIRLESFFVPVGNQAGQPLESVNLRTVLRDPRAFLTDPQSWAGRTSSLLADRDTHVLVSAQAAFLPIPPGGTATFNPVLFNYQSQPGDPAVLTLLATPQGSSMTIIDNQRDRISSGWAGGQRLFFNQQGERASLTGTRLSDFQAEQGEDPGQTGAVEFEVEEDSLNVVLLIQVPLKQRQTLDALELAPMPAAPMAMEQSSVAARDAGIEAAVIGHGEVEGEFVEIDGLEIERDPRFPIRVTVQFYKATTTGEITETDMAQIREEIERVYEVGDHVGSLVTQGLTQRPTEHTGPRWWPWRPRF